MPLTQIKMDQESITLSVGPGGLLAQIKMDPTGVTISGTPASQLMVQPSGITTMTPMVTVGFGPVTFVSPSVTIPIAEIGRESAPARSAASCLWCENANAVAHPIYFCS